VGKVAHKLVDINQDHIVRLVDRLEEILLKSAQEDKSEVDKSTVVHQFKEAKASKAPPSQPQP
jgi:hypothetical protein